MIDLVIMIGVCFFLANQIEIKSRKYTNVRVAVKKDWLVKILYFILLLILIFFSGLRTTYNDTETYMQAYERLNISDVHMFSILEPYGGFIILQTFLKRYISEDPQILILVSSIMVNSVFVYFYSKYSKHFGLTIFSHLILGTYIFSMAGIKQIMAMSISLFAIENLLRKKYLKFFIWLLVAMTFHPYIICLAVLPFFREGVWNKKIVMTIFIVIFLAANLEVLLNFAGMIGKEYTIEEMTDYTVNPIRVLIEIIPVIFSLLYRAKINKRKNELLNLSINMMIINAFMISLGLFFNPIYFARIGTYFSVLNAIAIPIMLTVIYQKNEHYRMNIFVYYAFYCLYFMLDLTKLGAISITHDLFNHINIF